MRRCRSWYRIRQLLHTRLPLPPGPLRDSLALWLQGTLWVGRGVASPRHSPLPGLD